MTALGQIMKAPDAAKWALDAAQLPESHRRAHGFVPSPMSSRREWMSRAANTRRT